ncbi:MAG: toll/interleukin-1 receptor domain-containing protein, partial [Chloroflexi bacterium]|nr:toll/interleukin-1 receptor domain-containing protein [Chloroflexota bacterium]
MGDIFISYVEEDAAVVEPLAAALSDAGYSCWYYHQHSIAGTSYLTQISEAISQAKVVILVLSPQTLDSFQVDKEISFAHESNKPFLPITHDLAWGDFQQRRPTWRLAIGTSVAIPIPPTGIGAMLPRVIEGLRGLSLASAHATPVDRARLGLASSELSATNVGHTLPLPQSLVERRAPPDSLPTRASFVGRTRELDFLQTEYDVVASGQGGRLVFISGEPGIGKTRLAQEVGLYAWSKGGLFLEGTYLRDGTAPYGAWVDALRAAVRSLTRHELAAVLVLQFPFGGAFQAATAMAVGSDLLVAAAPARPGEDLVGW